MQAFLMKNVVLHFGHSYDIARKSGPYMGQRGESIVVRGCLETGVRQGPKSDLTHLSEMNRKLPILEGVEGRCFR